MIHRLVQPRLRAVTVAAASLLLGLGAAGAVGALTVGGQRGAAGAPQAGGGYIVCVAYQQQFGICIGPPTN